MRLQDSSPIPGQQLRDISHEDCLKEGLSAEQLPAYITYGYRDKEYKFHRLSFRDARPAFAALIDKICGKGTWESNPWVFVYDFELIK